MTIREKLDLLAKSEDRNAAILAAYEEGVTSGIGATLACFNITEETARDIATQATFYIREMLPGLWLDNEGEKS